LIGWATVSAKKFFILPPHFSLPPIVYYSSRRVKATAVCNNTLYHELLWLKKNYVAESKKRTSYRYTQTIGMQQADDAMQYYKVVAIHTKN
jgi:hypothetical protein